MSFVLGFYIMMINDHSSNEVLPLPVLVFRNVFIAMQKIGPVLQSPARKTIGIV